MKPLGTVYSLDQTRCAVIYREKSGLFTVASRKPNDNEFDFETHHDVFSACDAAKARVK